MSDDRRAQFARAESIFVAVCDLPPGERERRIDELSGGDASLAGTVRSLLVADEAATTPIDTNGWSGLAPADETHPESIADFEIVRVLGQGGMGIVYEAMQQSPRRRVALKVIRGSMTTTSALRRFEIEAQILAKLQHPGIATIYDSGIDHTPAGPRPYVAMELVEGEPVTVYANRKALGPRARVELIRDVSRAVAHAHDRGVIHRDLKPANIFVTGDGGVKVLDFGIAFDSEARQNTLLTQAGQLVGTLPYMAPEQVADNSGRADSRTDVYAIGLIAYELLTGVRPITDPARGPYEIIRAIREDEASLAGSINRALRGDIEIILAKSLEKDPLRRYADAGELADDLERHLASRPIVARPASAWYQFRKFSKRNPALVGAAGAIFLVLTVAIVLIAGALRTAQHDRDEARHSEYIATAMNTYMFEDLFAAADPNADGDPDITLLDAMRLAAAGLSERFAQSPEVEAQLRQRMGVQFLVMNQLDDARLHLERSLELSRSLGVDVETMIARLNGISMLYSDTNELKKAAAVLDEASALISAHPDVSVEARIDTLSNTASIQYHSGDREGSVVTFEKAVRLGRAEAPEYMSTVSSMGSLGLVYQQLGRLDESAAVQEESVAISERLVGRHHPDSLRALNNLALLYLSLDRVDEAIDLLEEVLTERLKVFGEDHVQTAVSHANLGRALGKMGNFPEAERETLTAFGWMNEHLGPDHRYTVVARQTLFELYTKFDRPDEAARYEPLP